MNFSADPRIGHWSRRGYLFLLLLPSSLGICTHALHFEAMSIFPSSACFGRPVQPRDTVVFFEYLYCNSPIFNF